MVTSTREMSRGCPHVASGRFSKEELEIGHRGVGPSAYRGVRVGHCPVQQMGVLGVAAWEHFGRHCEWRRRGWGEGGEPGGGGEGGELGGGEGGGGEGGGGWAVARVEVVEAAATAAAVVAAAAAEAATRVVVVTKAVADSVVAPTAARLGDGWMCGGTLVDPCVRHRR